MATRNSLGLTALNYETGLARGFNYFDDYSLSPQSLLCRAVHGKWMLENIGCLGDYYVKKWLGLQSRGASDLNGKFLNWLKGRRPDRPFFAFLNCFDAHEPYVAPANNRGRFGIMPASLQDYQFLFDFVGANKTRLRTRDWQMVRDAYDDCIAFLDEQLGRLLDELQAQGLLENTDVIITSDHGESFGEHGSFCHSYSVYLEETAIPLVILSPRAPSGKVVYNAVSLRDLPATVMDLLGLAAESPFPGQSLAAYWGLAPTQITEITSPALTEQAHASTFQQPRSDTQPSGPQLSLVAMDHHYIRQDRGVEQLFDLLHDPLEQFNLIGSTKGDQWVRDFRRMLLEALTRNPGAAEVEKAYLSAFRERLSGLVESTRGSASR